MMDLFSQTSNDCSKIITKNYSTSFSLGIRCFDDKFRAPICGIYSFVRFADEIVDTFHDFDKAELLKRFRADTYLAIKEKISLNPVLHSFQQVVNKYGIELELIDAFLNSMETDLHQSTHEADSYNIYIYGSAEVVGLMCLKVFCENDQDLYNNLKEPARRLGAAFQKVNFLRDLKSDYTERGRIYFPGVEYNLFDTLSKKKIEEDINMDFNEAFSGIQNLPTGAKLGVYLAYVYYKELFRKIKASSTDLTKTSRIRVNNTHKMMLLCRSAFKVRFNMI